MKIKKEFLSVSSLGVDADGRKLEAEEQPVVNVIETVAPATMRNGGVVGALPTQIVAHAQASELAAAKGRQCYGCRWWHHEQWLQSVRDAEGPLGTHEDRQAINDVRAALLGGGGAKLSTEYPDRDEGGPDVEVALHAMGICGALTEHERAVDPEMGPKEWVVTFPTASCPLSVVTPTQPYGFFKPRDAEADRMMGANRDAVLFRAAGKRP